MADLFLKMQNKFKDITYFTSGSKGGGGAPGARTYDFLCPKR